MSDSKVAFAGNREKFGDGKLEKISRLLDAIAFDDLFEPGDLVAVKVHFGERGNTGYVSPVLVRVVVDRLVRLGARPFLTDSNTLYVGTRANAVDHLNTAILNGFDFAVAGAPLLIADGLTGRDYVSVPVGLKHFDEVKISSAAHYADAIIAVSHFKGHELTGFGAALKNLGMGLGSPAGKQMMHSGVKPKVGADKCTACGRCGKWCPAKAIEIKGKAGEAAAVIDETTCIGCGECTVVCPERAIAINWATTDEEIQQKIVEYAVGALAGKRGKSAFLNFLTHITPDCDCYGWSDAPIVGDIGILASRDAVAVDQASVDLFNDALTLTPSRLNGQEGETDRLRAIHGREWNHQLAYAEEVGLGRRAYELIEV